jgi:hypothetical protein
VQEAGAILHRLQQASEAERQLGRAVQQQSARLSAMRTADDPARGAHSVMALQTTEAALQQSHAACVGRIETAHTLRAELERLVGESSAMIGEANALLDELEALGRSAEDLERAESALMAPIGVGAAALREAWASAHERMALLATAIVPKALQLGSTPDKLTALIPQSLRAGHVSVGGGEGGDASMADEEHLDVVDTFVQATRGAARVLHPMLADLGQLVAAAAEGGLAGGASTGTAGATVVRAPSSGDDGGAAMARLAEVAGGATAGSPPVQQMPPSNGGAVEPAPGAVGGVGFKGQKQERNVHALTVLRRIKCKLDGMDKWPGKARETKQSVSEQVETVIKHAVSPDNLCLMYEGWSPWC